MKKNKKWFWSVCLHSCIMLLFIAVHVVHAQLPEMQPIVEEGIPEYYYDVVSFAAEDSGMSLLKFYSKVSYDELQFIQEDNQYHAEYEVSIVAFNRQGNQENGKILKRDVVVDRFERTNSIMDFDLVEIEFTIAPGDYELLIELIDLESRKTGYQKMDINIPDYGGSLFHVSHVILADTVVVDSSGELNYEPNVINNFQSSQQSLFVYYEIYNRLSIDSVKVVYEIQDSRETVLRQESYYKELEEGIKTVDAFKIMREGLESGQYRLVVEVGEDESVIKYEKDFTIRWMGLPAVISDIDEAIDQLRYIAEGSEIKRMREAEDDEKRRLFERFWSSKDPSPGTRNNENMEEYYRRVQFTNEAFGSGHNGWETDRGMVFITLGAPDEVERHPFDLDTYPYVVWYYYQWSTRFIFQSYSGYGELRLINPGDFWDISERMQ
jgi:GWxTD domain-containing protein